MIAGGIVIVCIAVAAALTAHVVAQNATAGSLADGTAWGPTLGAEVQRAPHINGSVSGTGQGLAVSPSTKAAYALGSDGLYLVDNADLERSTLAPIALDAGSLSAIALAPDGTRAYLTAGSGSSRTGEMIAVSLNGDKVIEDYRAALPGSGNLAEHIAVSKDGGTLFLADVNTGFSAVSTSDGTVLVSPSGSTATVVAVNPVDGTVATNSGVYEDDQILLMDETGTHELSRVPFEGGLPSQMAFSPDGKTLAVGAERRVDFYEADGTHRETIESSARFTYTDMAFSSDSAKLAVLVSSEGDSSSGAIQIIDVASAQQLVEIPVADRYILGNLAFTASPGELLALSSDGLVRVDVGASRTNWAGYIAVLVFLLVLLLGAVGAAATLSRWQPALAASNRRRRTAKAQRKLDEDGRVSAMREEQATAVAEAEERRAKAEHEERVRQVQQWREAYREANGGQEPPEGFSPVVIPGPTAPPASSGTNTMAILAIIFGIGGGLLGVVFGHVALRQIRRTGESGRGLAIAGLVFGYLGLTVLIVWLVVVFVVLGSTGGY